MTEHLHRMRWRILSILVTLVFAAFLAFRNEYGWALYAGALVLLQLWLASGALEPLRQEKAVLDLLNRFGGKSSREQLEAAIEQASEEWGVLSGEYVENMMEALNRLERKGCIREEDARMQLVHSSPNKYLRGRRN